MQSFNDNIGLWTDARKNLAVSGFTLLHDVVNPLTCSAIADLYEDTTLFRKTINMERYRFGKGEYKYFSYPLPETLQSIRENVYREVVAVANVWMKQLGLPTTYPLEHEEFLRQCKAAGQVHPTVLMLKYQAGGFNTLHQDLYGDLFFPFQLVIFLKEPGKDYEGGSL